MSQHIAFCMNPDVPPLLVAKGLTKKYGNLQILKNIDLSISKGDLVVLTGPSGAGKSTLLHILATLDKPNSGSLYIGGQDLLAIDGDALARFRNRHIGFVFQFHNLLPEFNAFENVCLPGYIGKFDSKQTVESKARDLLALLNLSDRMNHKPSALSGGEQQRVAVARALINNPTIVFADEPSGSLDSTNATLLHDLFFDLRIQLGQTFVLATHNQGLADRADRKIIMQDGELLMPK